MSCRSLGGTGDSRTFYVVGDSAYTYLPHCCYSFFSTTASYCRVWTTAGDDAEDAAPAALLGDLITYYWSIGANII
jgi:hypothetical protein